MIHTKATRNSECLQLEQPAVHENMVRTARVMARRDITQQEALGLHHSHAVAMTKGVPGPHTYMQRCDYDCRYYCSLLFIGCRSFIITIIVII